MSRIVSIIRKRIKDERLLNLAVAEDESFVANGIVVHNCKSYLVANLQGSGKKIDDNGLQPSKASLNKYVTLSEISAGQFAIAYIDVAKTVAQTLEQSRTIADGVTALEPGVQATEMESAYRWNILDPSLLVSGSLKSFEPAEGICVYYGKFQGQGLT